MVHRVPGEIQMNLTKYQAGFREGDYYVVDGVTHQRPIDLNKPNNGVIEAQTIPTTDPFGDTRSSTGTSTSTSSDKYASEVLSFAAGWVGMQKTVISAIPAGLTGAQAAGLSAYGYAVSTPLAIASHWNNPHLTSENKWALTGLEVGYAFTGIAFSYAAANIWNPSGWVAAVIGAGG